MSSASSTLFYGFHITSYEISQDIIIKKSFWVKDFNVSVFRDLTKKTNMPNDLGNGIYFFLESHYPVHPRNICIDYYKGVKSHNYGSKYGLVKCQIDLDKYKYNIYDLNDSRNRFDFNAFKQTHQTKLENILKSGIKESNVYQRALKENFIDGLAFEYLSFIYNDKGQNIDAIIMDTFMEYSPSYSRVPNCTELCVRNKEMILTYEKG